MATEQEVAAMRERLGNLEAADRERTKSAAIAQELGRYELASPAAAEQLRELLVPTLDLTTGPDGRTLIFNKNDYNPLTHVVAETLQRPEFAHFLKANAAAPAASQPAAPVRQPAAPAGAPPSAVREILPGETFGSAIARVATSKRAAQGDPRLDPSQPFGLRPLPR